MFDLLLPMLTFTFGGKGGIGKTLLALILLDLYELNGIAYDVMQLDDQQRLAKALKRSIVSLDLRTAKRARQDPKALTKTFAPMHEAISQIRSLQRCLHIDIGATQQHSLFDYSGLVSLDEDLMEFGVQAIAFILVTADAEAIEQAVRSLETLRSVLPSVQPILVLNERDGTMEDLPEGSDAHNNYRRLLAPRLSTLPSVRMPLIPAGSWQSFERQSMRVLDVVALDTAGVMAATGLSRPEAKLARGDVQAVFDAVEQGLSAHLPFLRAGEGERC